MRIKQALTKLKQEIIEMDLRIGVVSSTVFELPHFFQFIKPFQFCDI